MNQYLDINMNHHHLVLGIDKSSTAKQISNWLICRFKGTIFQHHDGLIYWCEIGAWIRDKICWRQDMLTAHWRLATILHSAFSNSPSCCIFTQISLKVVPKGPTEKLCIGSDNGLALTKRQAILSEPMLDSFNAGFEIKGSIGAKCSQIEPKCS